MLQSRLKFDNTIFFLLIALIWGVVIVLMQPWGDFPLNDDWGYAWSVKQLLDNNRLQLLTVVSPLVYFQVLLGSAVSLIFGFSFVTLRLLVLGCALIALWSLWGILQQADVRTKNAFIAVLILMINPWFMNLSFIFMTDVPALAFLLLAVMLMIRGYQLDRPILVVLANLFALAGMFIRQNGALFFIAAIIAVAFNINKEKAKHSLIITLIFTVLAEGLYLWLGHLGLLPAATVFNLLDLHTLLSHILEWLTYGLLYLGLLLLPLLAGIAIAQYRIFMDVKTGLLLLLSCGTVSHLWNKGKYFPYVDNIITPSGLGPTMNVLQGVETVMFPVWVWGILSILAAVGTALLLRLLVHIKLRLLKNRHLPFALVLVGSLAGLQFLLVLMVRSFDRYLLPSLALLIAYFGLYYGRNFNLHRPTALLITVMIGLYSFVGTQNYLNWNEVRWKEADALIKQGIDAEQIEAGFEWCGWQLYIRSRGVQSLNDPSKPWYLNFICPINTAEYVISFSELPGYKIIKKTTYFSLYDTSPWLYLLEKNR